MSVFHVLSRSAESSWASSVDVAMLRAIEGSVAIDFVVKHEF